MQPDRRSIVCAIGTAAAAAAAAAGARVPAGATSLAKSALFRESGQRGFGVGPLRSVGPARSTLDVLRLTGANAVRLFLLYARSPGSSSYTLAEGYEALNSTVSLLSAVGVQVVIVVSLGEDARGALWLDPRLQDSLIEVWKEIAERLSGSNAVIGLDLLNEPVPPGRTFAERQRVWLEFVTRIGTAIRRIDDTRTLIVGSAPDTTPDSYVNMRPVDFDNVVYSVHSYRPMSLTHQYVLPDYQSVKSYGRCGERDYCRADLEGSLQHALEFSSRHRVPMVVSEFSCVRFAPGLSAAMYVKDSIELFQAYGWSWFYHELRGWPGWDAEMRSGTRATTPRRFYESVMQELVSGFAI